MGLRDGGRWKVETNWRRLLVFKVNASYLQGIRRDRANTHASKAQSLWSNPMHVSLCEEVHSKAGCGRP
jgi:hypothetical protein